MHLTAIFAAQLKTTPAQRRPKQDWFHAPAVNIAFKDGLHPTDDARELPWSRPRSRSGKAASEIPKDSACLGKNSVKLEDQDEDGDDDSRQYRFLLLRHS